MVAVTKAIDVAMGVLVREFEEMEENNFAAERVLALKRKYMYHMEN